MKEISNQRDYYPFMPCLTIFLIFSRSLALRLETQTVLNYLSLFFVAKIVLSRCWVLQKRAQASINNDWLVGRELL